MAEDRPMTVKERMAMFNKKKESPAPLEKASSGRFPKNNTTQNQTIAVDPIAKSPSNIKQEKITIEKTEIDLRPTSSSTAPVTSHRTTSSETTTLPGKLSSNKFNNFNGSNSNVNINPVKFGTPPPPVAPTRISPASNINKSPTSNITKILPPNNFPKTEPKSTNGTVKIPNDTAAVTSPENKGTLNANTKSNISPTSTGTKQTYDNSAGTSETGPSRQSVKKLSAGIGANINMNSFLGKSPPPRPASRAITPPFTPEGSGSSGRPVSTPISPNQSGELQHLNMGRPKSYNRRLSTTPDKSIFHLLAETKLLTMEEEIDNDTSPK